MAGTAALSSASAVRANAAANYDTKVGPAINVALGYHFSDWVSAQAGYAWNRNRFIVSQLAGSTFSQSENTAGQSALTAEAMLYFRPRASRLRPYLSAGPAFLSLPNEQTAGLRVAVGIDVRWRRGWGVRYSFGEVMSSNPFAKTLNPPAAGKLMNFQSLFGVTKTF